MSYDPTNWQTAHNMVNALKNLWSYCSDADWDDYEVTGGGEGEQ